MPNFIGSKYCEVLKDGEDSWWVVPYDCDINHKMAVKGKTITEAVDEFEERFEYRALLINLYWRDERRKEMLNPTKGKK